MLLHRSDATQLFASIASDLNAQADVGSTRIRIVQLAVKEFAALGADLIRTRADEEPVVWACSGTTLGVSPVDHEIISRPAAPDWMLRHVRTAGAANRARIDSILTLQLRDGGKEVGALRIFTTGHNWTPEQIAAARAFAGQSVLAVRRAELTQSVATLTAALESNRIIAMACGILMATDKLTAEQAIRCLMKMSQDTNRKVGDVADLVLLMGRLPTRVELGVRQHI